MSNLSYTARRIPPSMRYLLDEFSESEELQAQFHEVDLSLINPEVL
jgi:hypothetical protein